jgi:hypothetical protein
MGCSSCKQNNHVVPSASVHNTTTQTYCECACGCEEPICPTPQPCTEITDSKCIIYTDAPIKCGDDTVVTTNASVSTALNQITNFFCNNTPPPPPPVSSGIQIPQLNIVSKDTTRLFASILPGTHSNDYLNHNPKIFLFVKRNARSKRVKDINGDLQKKYYYGGWRHTTHMQGINFPNGNFYSGNTNCPTHTEFPLSTFSPYDHQELVDFDAGEFYVAYLPGYGLGVPAPLKTLTLPWTITNLNKIKARGRKEEPNTRSVYFRFAIGIENPDTTSPYPIVFGPMTASIQCKLVKRDGLITYAINHDPTNIKHFNH